jgi:hypothetical protein
MAGKSRKLRETSSSLIRLHLVESQIPMKNNGDNSLTWFDQCLRTTGHTSLRDDPSNIAALKNKSMTLFNARGKNNAVLIEKKNL